MKNALVSILASCLALVLWNCSDSSITPEDGSSNLREGLSAPTSNLVGSSWTLVAFHEGAGETMVPPDQPYTISFDEVRASGQADCKGYNYGYDATNGLIRFYDPGPQIMLYCGDESLDRRYYAALESATSYAMDGDRLFIYYNGESGKLEFVASGGNPGGGGSMTIPDAYGVTWKLEGFEVRDGGTASVRPVPEGQIYTLVFNQANASGNAHCNQFGIDYRTGDPNALTFFGMNSTDAFCGDGSLIGEYYNALQTAVSYEMTQTTLRINYRNGMATLIYRQADAEEEPITAQPIRLVDLSAYGPGVSNPFRIMEASIDNHVITLTVQYNGGCTPHEFNLFGPDPMPADGSARIVTYLVHDSHADACRTTITENRQFDLRPLRDAYIQSTGIQHGTIDIAIDPRRKSVAPTLVRYTF